MTDATYTALDLHLARCACGFVVSGRSLATIRDAMNTHFQAVEFPWAEMPIESHAIMHYPIANSCSPDPVAAKLLLGAVKLFEVEAHVWKCAALFVMDCSHAELSTYCKKRWRVTMGDDVQQVGQMFTFHHAPWRVVWVEKRPVDFVTLGILLHEVFHLVTRICQDKGVPIKAQIEDGNGDEAAAYLYDYFAREAIRRSGTIRFRGRP